MCATCNIQAEEKHVSFCFLSLPCYEKQTLIKYQSTHRIKNNSHLQILLLFPPSYTRHSSYNDHGELLHNNKGKYFCNQDVWPVLRMWLWKMASTTTTGTLLKGHHLLLEVKLLSSTQRLRFKVNGGQEEVKKLASCYEMYRKKQRYEHKGPLVHC